jgi:uncharacterized membrane protein
MKKMAEGASKVRNLGIFILILGIVILLGSGFYYFVKEFIMDINLPIIIKLGLSGVLIGVFVLLISLIKERIEEKGDKK